MLLYLKQYSIVINKVFTLYLMLLYLKQYSIVINKVLTHTGPSAHTTCLARNYFTNARKMLRSATNYCKKLLLLSLVLNLSMFCSIIVTFFTLCPVSLFLSLSLSLSLSLCLSFRIGNRKVTSEWGV